MGWFSTNNKHYTQAAEIRARELEKQSANIKDAVDKSLGIETRHYEENKKALMPAFKVTRNAIKDLEKRAKAGDFQLQSLKLAKYDKTTTFDDYLKEKGFDQEGYTAFDYVQDFKNRVKNTGQLDDPAFDFGLRQQQRALARRQAASGTRLSGVGARELSEHAIDYSNTRYGEAHQRAMAEGQLREQGVLNRFGLRRQSELDERARVTQGNQVEIDEWEAHRAGIQNELAVLREQLNLDGVRDMTRLTDMHSQNKQQTILTGATAQANLGIAAADARAQGIIDKGEADAAGRRSLGQLAGTLIGAGIGAVAGGPWGAAIGANLGSVATGGSGGVPVPSKSGQTPVASSADKTGQTPVTIPNSWSRLRKV